MIKNPHRSFPFGICLRVSFSALWFSLFGSGLCLSQIQVKGRGVDIIEVEEGSWLWSDVSFPETLPEELKGKTVATFRCLPIPEEGQGGDSYDTREDQIIESVFPDKNDKLLIAFPTADLRDFDWTRLSEKESFKLRNGEKYWFYEHKVRRAGDWVDLPDWRGAGRDHPPMVVGEPGEIIFANPLPLNGTVIDRSGLISNVNMIIMPNGDYLANCSGVPHWKIWRSTDKGETWERWGKPYPKINFQALFEHRGHVYLLGREKNDPDAPFPACAVIYKSGDGGKSFSGPTYIPVSIANGVKADSAPAHVDVAEGRLWRAVQGKIGDDEYSPGLLSAPVDADLMDASSWSYAPGPAIDKSWVTTSGRNIRFWDEGTTVVTREGIAGNLAKTGIYRTRRADGTGEAGAAFIYPEPPEKCGFSPEHGFVILPGAGSKFTIRYDPKSYKYWALTSVGPVRSNLNLYSSSDLKTFKFEKNVLHGPSSRFHGFNYPFMQIDGDDIVFVLRTAFEDKGGQAKRWHDAHLFTFHRIASFRDAGRSGKPGQTE